MNFLGCVDHDESYETAARNAVASLRGRDAREEVGLGGLWDTLSVRLIRVIAAAAAPIPHNARDSGSKGLRKMSNYLAQN